MHTSSSRIQVENDSLRMEISNLKKTLTNISAQDAVYKSHTQRIPSAQSSQEEHEQPQKTFYQIKLENLRTTIHQMKEKATQNTNTNTNTADNNQKSIENESIYSLLQESKTFDEKATKNKYSPQTMPIHNKKAVSIDYGVQTNDTEQTYKLKYETAQAEINNLKQLLEEREQYYEQQATELRKEVMGLKDMITNLFTSKNTNPLAEKKSKGVANTKLKELKHSIDNIKLEIEKVMDTSNQQNKTAINYSAIDETNEATKENHYTKCKSQFKQKVKQHSNNDSLVNECRNLLNAKKSRERDIRIVELSNSPNMNYKKKLNNRRVSQPKTCYYQKKGMCFHK